MSVSEDLSLEAFREWASQLGLHLEGERLEALHREVRGMFQRLAPLNDVDVSEVPVEAAAPMPAGTDGGGPA